MSTSWRLRLFRWISVAHCLVLFTVLAISMIKHITNAPESPVNRLSWWIQKLVFWSSLVQCCIVKWKMSRTIRKQSLIDSWKTIRWRSLWGRMRPKFWRRIINLSCEVFFECFTDGDLIRWCCQAVQLSGRIMFPEVCQNKCSWGEYYHAVASNETVQPRC